MPGENPIMPVNYVNIGGVRFNSNEIEKAIPISNKNGRTEHCVVMKNGMQITYPTQFQSIFNIFKPSERRERGPEVDAYFGDGLDYVHFFNLKDAKIKGSESEEFVAAYDCKSCEFDLANDNKEDEVVIYQGLGCVSEKNVVKTDKKDDLRFTREIPHEDGMSCPDQDLHMRVKGEGVTSEESVWEF